MNKKFSTLMMAGMLVAAPSFVSAQDVTLNGKPLELVKFNVTNVPNSKSSVIVIRDLNGDKEINNGDLVLYGSKDNAGNLTYAARPIQGNKVEFEVENKALWTLTEKDGKGTLESTSVWLYGLKNNEIGRYLTVKADGSIEKTLDGSKKDLELGSIFTLTPGNQTTDQISKDAGEVWHIYKVLGDNTPNDFYANTDGFTFGNSTGDNSVGLIFATFAEREVSVVDELNDMQGGKGFQFKVNTAVDPEKIHENVFHGLDLRAFNVDGNLEEDGFQPIEWTANSNKYSIPTGIYLVSDYSKLANVKGGKEALETNTISTLDQFKALTFVAADPQEYVKLAATDGDNRKKNGYGFVFRSDVTWEEMNFYATPETDANYNANEVSEKAEVFVNNARFFITANDPMTANDVYTLKLEGARFDLANDGKHGAKDVFVSHISQDDYIDETDEPSRSYLLTGKEAVKVTAVPSSTIADVTELLNKDMTPAIYAIKFVSGADDEISEYGQYLTARNHNSVAVMPNVNINDPLNQFIVSGVLDSDKNGECETIIMNNRQTGSKLAAVLYNEKEEGVYTIYPVAGQSTELSVATTDNNGKLKLQNKSIKGMKAQVIKIEEVDKFASFESRDKELGLVSFELAKTEESVDRLYVAAKRNDDGTIDYAGRVKTSTEADKFELVRSDSYEYLTNDFIYLDGKTVKTAATVKDTVAFYTYDIKYFAPDVETSYYLKDASLAATAETVVIKYNADNSVAILAADGANDLRNSSTQSYISGIEPNGTIDDDKNLDKDALSKNTKIFGIAVRKGRKCAE